MAKGMGLVEYLITGLKIWVVGIVTLIILLLPMLAIGYASFSMIGLATQNGSPGTIATGLSGGVWLTFTLASLIIQGYLANKMWKWR